jgi:hypothetical protein
MERKFIMPKILVTEKEFKKSLLAILVENIYDLQKLLGVKFIYDKLKSDFEMIDKNIMYPCAFSFGDGEFIKLIIGKDISDLNKEIEKLYDGNCSLIKAKHLTESESESNSREKILNSFKEIQDVFKQRSKQYKSNYMEFGKVLKSLFPEEVKLETEEDFARFAALVSVVGKLHRYTINFKKGGHKDSLVDLVNYTMILNYMDEKCFKERKTEDGK